jgi:hypothetical protein
MSAFSDSKKLPHNHINKRPVTENLSCKSFHISIRVRSINIAQCMYTAFRSYSNWTLPVPSALIISREFHPVLHCYDVYQISIVCLEQIL